MSYTLKWEEPAGLLVTYTGIVAPADFLQLLQRVTADPRYASLRYMISDFRAADGHCFAVDDPDELAQAIAAGIGAAYSNPYVFETAINTSAEIEPLLAAYARLMKLHPFEVFDSEVAAREWLSTQSFSMRRPQFPR